MNTEAIRETPKIRTIRQPEPKQLKITFDIMEVVEDKHEIFKVTNNVIGSFKIDNLYKPTVTGLQAPENITEKVILDFFEEYETNNIDMLHDFLTTPDNVYFIQVAPEGIDTILNYLCYDETPEDHIHIISELQQVTGNYIVGFSEVSNIDILEEFLHEPQLLFRLMYFSQINLSDEFYVIEEDLKIITYSKEEYVEAYKDYFSSISGSEIVEHLEDLEQLQSYILSKLFLTPRSVLIPYDIIINDMEYKGYFNMISHEFKLIYNPDKKDLTYKEHQIQIQFNGAINTLLVDNYKIDDITISLNETALIKQLSGLKYLNDISDILYKWVMDYSFYYIDHSLLQDDIINVCIDDIFKDIHDFYYHELTYQWLSEINKVIDIVPYPVLMDSQEFILNGLF